VFFNTVPTKGVTCANRAVVRALWCGETAGREARRQLSVDIPQKVLLLEAEPEIVVVIVNGGASVGRMRRAIGVQNFTHDEVSVVSVWIWVDGDGLE